MAAILVRHASYFLMYSSHSATQVFGAVETELVLAVVVPAVFVAIAVLATVVVFAGLIFVLTVVFVFAAPPQPIATIAKPIAAAIMKKLLILIV